MRGSGDRQEGNNASYPKSQKGRSKRNDLGLTLLPGSQIQKEDDRDIGTALCCEKANRISRKPRDGRHQELKGNGGRAKVSIDSTLANTDQQIPPPPTTILPRSSSRGRTPAPTTLSTRKHIVAIEDLRHLHSLVLYDDGSSNVLYRPAAVLDEYAELNKRPISDNWLKDVVVPHFHMGTKIEISAFAPRFVRAGTKYDNAYEALQTCRGHQRSTSVPVILRGRSHTNPQNPLPTMTQAGCDSNVGASKHNVIADRKVRSWTRYFPSVVTKPKSEDNTSHPISSSSLTSDFLTHTKQTRLTETAHFAPLPFQDTESKRAFIWQSRISGVRESSPQSHDAPRAEPSISFPASKSVSFTHDTNHPIRRARSLPNLHPVIVRLSSAMSSSPSQCQLPTPPREVRSLPPQDNGHDSLLGYGQDSFDQQLQQTLLPTYSQSTPLTDLDLRQIILTSTMLPDESTSPTPSIAKTPVSTHPADQQLVIYNPSPLPIAAAASEGFRGVCDGPGLKYPVAQVRRLMQRLHPNAEKQIQGLREQLQSTARDLQALSKTHARLEDAYHSQEIQNTTIKSRALKAERANRALQKQLATSQNSNTFLQAKYDNLVKQLQDQMDRAVNGPRPQFGQLPTIDKATDSEACLASGSHQYAIRQTSKRDCTRDVDDTLPFADNDGQDSFLFPSPVQTQSTFSEIPNLYCHGNEAHLEYHDEGTMATPVTPFGHHTIDPKDMTFDQLGKSIDAMFSNEQGAETFGGQNVSVSMLGDGMITGGMDEATALTKDFTPGCDSFTHSRQPSTDSRRSSLHARHSSMSDNEKKEKKRLSNLAYRENERRKRKLAFMLGEDSEGYKQEVAKLKTASGRESRAGCSPKRARLRSKGVEENGGENWQPQVSEQDCGRVHDTIAAGMNGFDECDGVSAGPFPGAIDFDEATFLAMMEAEVAEMQQKEEE
ncbi:MAG: hypothetical protein Q9217_000937 [Psora testacea]